MYNFCFVIETLLKPLISEKPDIIGWRQKLQWFGTKVLFKTYRLSLGLFINVTGKYEGKEKAAAIVFGPHSSILDNLIVDAVGSILSQINFQTLSKIYRAKNLRFPGLEIVFSQLLEAKLMTQF